jgi:hypothetical protein
MFNEVPASGKGAGVVDGVNSKSWFIPVGSTVWKWEVSKDSGSSWEWIQTDIPSEAYSTEAGDNIYVSNVVLSNVQTSAGMVWGGGTLYYQRGNADQFGCSSSGGTWFGMVRSTQGAPDLLPNGIGGACA